jgi:uncharacterized protein YwqG
MMSISMKFKQTLTIKEASAPINSPITKFGGQPVWLETPQWPISRQLKKPMRFICQIKLEDTVFPGGEGKMAYLFMTDDEEYVDGTWKANGGENAVIIQPEGLPAVATQALETGPTLKHYRQVDGEELLQAVDVELEAQLNLTEDPDYIAESVRVSGSMSEDELRAYYNQIEGNKVGGVPDFLQSEAFPDDKQDWQLLLQLDSCDQPFTVNFGGSGIGYAFINESLSEGRFIWQN